jgi:hypothetical protein
MWVMKALRRLLQWISATERFGLRKGDSWSNVLLLTGSILSAEMGLAHRLSEWID